MPACDKCPAEYRWIVGDAQTGAQEFLCDDHRGGQIAGTPPGPSPAGPDPAVPETTQCEMCGVEPLAVIWELPDHSQRLYLGDLCALTLGRVRYLTVDDATQVMVAGAAEEQMSRGKRGKRAKRQSPNGVAVHNAGDPSETVEAAELSHAAVGHYVEGDAPETAPDPED